MRLSYIHDVVIVNNAYATNIERISQNSYTALCNGVISYGALIGGIRFLPTKHVETNKQNASTMFMRRAAFQACLSSPLDHSTYAPDKSPLF